MTARCTQSVGVPLTNRKPLAARLTDSGALDQTFNPGGAGANGLVYALALLPNGQILIGGDFTTYNGVSSPRLARLNADGTLDPSFNVGVGADNTVYSIAVQADGNVVLGGRFNHVYGYPRNGVARLLGDGVRPHLQASRPGNFVLSFTSGSGRPYIVEASSDLRTWTGLTTNVTVSGLNAYAESVQPARKGWFYRVRFPAP